MEPDIIVRGERAALGPLRADLVADYARWSNEPEVRRGLLRRGIATPETEAEWVKDAMQEGFQRRPASVHFTIYDAADLAPVGSGGLFGIDHLIGRAGLGILLGERRGQGIGTDAVRLLLRWAFADLGLSNVMLEAMAWNESALRAYERAGFRPVGRRRGSLMSEGRRYDEVLMDAIPDDVLT